MDKMEREFVDANGDAAKVILEDSNGEPVNLKKGETYKLAMGPKKMRKKGVFTSSIGPGSHGFAQIATLATIVAVGGIIIAFIMFRL